MQVSYEESLANDFGLQRRGRTGKRYVLSIRAKGNAGQPLSSRSFACGVLLEQGAPLPCADLVLSSLAELSPMLRTLSRIEHQLMWHGNHD